MSRRNIVLFSVLPLLVVLLSVWQWQRFAAPEPDPRPDRATLLAWSPDQPEPVLVYGTNDPDGGTASRDSLTSWYAGSRRYSFELYPDSALTELNFPGRRLYLFGTLESNRWIDSLRSELPFQLEQGAFVVGKKRYDQPDQVLSFLIPNPTTFNDPLFILTGNTLAAMLSGPMVRFKGDYEVKDKNRTLAYGRFSQDEGSMWQMTDHLHKEFVYDAAPVHQEENFQISVTNESAYSSSQISTLVSEERERFARLKTFLDGRGPFPSVELILYPTFEDKGIMTGQTKFSHNAYDPPENRRSYWLTPVSPEANENQAHLIYSGETPYHNGYSDIQVVLRQVLGLSATPALENGLGIRFTDRFHGQPYSYWAALLHKSGNAIPLTDLLDPEMWSRGSELLQPPLAGALVDFLVESTGKERFLEQYTSWKPTSTELGLLQSGFNEYLDRLVARTDFSDHTQQLAEAPEPFFHKGLNYAHEGYQIYNGYLSDLSRESIDHAYSFGTNTLAAIPYTSMRQPTVPARLHFSSSAGNENDESLVAISRFAGKNGMKVMMKPQIWISGSWPGDIEMQSDREWEEFFEHYYRWIVHYALLAEMYQYDYFCIATEMSKATAGHEAEWISLIRRLKGIYSGEVTVAANWDAGFESQEFWNELDFIGINAYRTLSENENATDAELRDGAHEVVAFFRSLAQKYGKDIVFTEIGFTSTPRSWIRPYEYADGKDLDLSSQERSYRVMLEALYGEKWCRGFYWWKWPSYLEDGGMLNTGFTPAGKPAETVLGEWFGKDWLNARQKGPYSRPQ